MSEKAQSIHLAKGRALLRLGFVPLTDCAPLVIAQELGFFRKFDLRVSLSRELGWATVRDKILFGELDAAHAIGAMPLAATLGLGSAQCDCVAALVLNLHGNAITLSHELWKNGIRCGNTLREEIRRQRSQKKFVFGVVYPFSSHRHLLRRWLAAHSIDPDRDVRIVVVPPPQMAANLKAGNLDGFCAGEPWNSVAVETAGGWCVGVSSELAPGHPEKVLMARRDFVDARASEHLALVAALLEACAFCDAPENHEQIASILSLPHYVNVPAETLRRGLSGEFDFGRGNTRRVSDFCIFNRNDANEPSGDKVAWLLDLLRCSGLCPSPSALDFTLGRRVYRADIFAQAAHLNPPTQIHSQYEIRNEQLALT